MAQTAEKGYERAISALSLRHEDIQSGRYRFFSRNHGKKLRGQRAAGRDDGKTLA